MVKTCLLHGAESATNFPALPRGYPQTAPRATEHSQNPCSTTSRNRATTEGRHLRLCFSLARYVTLRATRQARKRNRFTPGEAAQCPGARRPSGVACADMEPKMEEEANPTIRAMVRLMSTPTLLANEGKLVLNPVRKSSTLHTFEKTLESLLGGGIPIDRGAGRGGGGVSWEYVGGFLEQSGKPGNTKQTNKDESNACQRNQPVNVGNWQVATARTSPKKNGLEMYLPSWFGRSRDSLV